MSNKNWRKFSHIFAEFIHHLYECNNNNDNIIVSEIKEGSERASSINGRRIRKLKDQSILHTWYFAVSSVAGEKMKRNREKKIN